MLIADRAALLLLDARGRRRVPARAAATVLAGALLSELVLRGDLDAAPGTGALRARPGAAPGPRLAAALEAVTATGGDAGRTVRALAAQPLWDDAVSALEGAGAGGAPRRRRLVVLTSVRWSPREGAVTALRTQVRAALQTARRRDRPAKLRAVDPATVSLVVLLAGAGSLPAVAPHLPGGPDPEEAADVLAGARDLTPQAREALEDVETAVSVRVHALTGGDSSADTSASGSGDGHHGHHGHHGGSDGGGDGGGGDGGGGGGD